MNLFVNDKPVTFISVETHATSQRAYQTLLDGQMTSVKSSELLGSVLVIESSVVLLVQLFALMREKKLRDFTSLTFVTADKKRLTDAVKSQFKIIKAAGGVVRKENNILLMYRLKKWDLPKGKLDKDEKAKAAAVREVEEECRIKVKLDAKICSTWHTYSQNGSRILKRTKWYAMTCADDSRMQPQVEEDIEELRWVDQPQAVALVEDSYQSIRFVLEMYYKKKKVMSNE